MLLQSQQYLHKDRGDKKEKTQIAEKWVHKDNAVVVYKYVGMKERRVAQHIMGDHPAA